MKSSSLVVVVQLLSHVWVFVTPWTAAHQLPLSSTISCSLLKFISIELVMLYTHLILCYPLLLCLQSFPASGSFPMSQLFTSGGQSIGASPSAPVLPMNIQGWIPLALTWNATLEKKKTKTKIMASSPITSLQIEGEKMKTMTDFIFLGSKITADCDCSHEIKRYLFAPWKEISDKPR